MSMRIGMFSESYEPVRNGVATSVRTLVDELRAASHHVCLVAPHFPDHEDDSPFVLRVPSLLGRMTADYPVPYPWFPKLRRELGKLNLNVLHSHSPWFLGLLAARTARRYRLPHVSTYHTLYENYSHYLSFLPEPATLGLLEWWIPEFYNGCDRVIVPSRVAERSLRGYGVEAPIEVIPTGVPLPAPEQLSESATRAARLRFGIPQDAPLLLYVGRIAREKNLELVIHTFAAIAQQWDDARLLIVGDGPHLDSCRELAESVPGGGRIQFPGAIPREELPPIYAAADLFLFGSATETQGLVVAEARAAGTPCVVCSEGGAAETVVNGEEGIVAPPRVEDFAAAAAALLAAPFRRAQLREQCRASAPLHTPEAMAARVAAVYESLAGARSEEEGALAAR